MIFFLVIVLWLVPIGLGAYLGSQRGKMAAGILLPLFFGWIGLIVVACLSDRTHTITVNQTMNGQPVNPDSPPPAARDPKSNPGYVAGLRDGE